MDFNEAVEKWKGTRYQHAGRTHSAGVDCIGFVICLLEDIGMDFSNELKHEVYPPDWHMHQTEERLLTRVVANCDEIRFNDLACGDLVLMKFGKCFSHASFYLGDCQVIHAVMRKGVIMSDLRHRFWKKPEKKFFRIRNK